jgi:signal transduction histidine kinase
MTLECSVASLDQKLHQHYHSAAAVLPGLQPWKPHSLHLDRAFSRVRAEFPMQSQIGLRIIVTGTPRPLRPTIGDEVYGIGHEALCNAFRHSHATDVEVEIEYAGNHLRIFVRDNGVGIACAALHSREKDHWGLLAMKERTERIGGRLRILSHAAAGTEVELSVPGQIAFEVSSEDRAVRWLSRLFS